MKDEPVVPYWVSGACGGILVLMVLFSIVMSLLIIPFGLRFAI